MDAIESANVYRFITVAGSPIVAGFGIVTWHYDRINDRNTSAEIARNKTEAATAKEEAAKANQVSKQLDLDLTKTRGEVLEQEAKVAELKAIVQREIRKRAEAEASLLVLQRRISSRRLNSSSFQSVLNGAPKAHVQILYNIADHEAELFSFLIFNELSKAQWEVEFPEPGEP